MSRGTLSGITLSDGHASLAVLLHGRQLCEDITTLWSRSACSQPVSQITIGFCWRGGATVPGCAKGRSYRRPRITDCQGSARYRCVRVHPGWKI